MLVALVCLFPALGFGKIAAGKLRIQADAKTVAVKPGGTPSLRWVLRSVPQGADIQPETPDILQDLQRMLDGLRNAKTSGECVEVVFDFTQGCGLLWAVRERLETQRKFSLNSPPELKKAPPAGAKIDTSIVFHYSTTSDQNSEIGALVIRIETDACVRSEADRRIEKPEVSEAAAGVSMVGVDATKISIELCHSALDLIAGRDRPPARRQRCGMNCSGSRPWH